MYLYKRSRTCVVLVLQAHGHHIGVHSGLHSLLMAHRRKSAFSLYPVYKAFDRWQTVPPAIRMLLFVRKELTIACWWAERLFFLSFFSFFFLLLFSLVLVAVCEKILMLLVGCKRDFLKIFLVGWMGILMLLAGCKGLHLAGCAG